MTETTTRAARSPAWQVLFAIGLCLMFAGAVDLGTGIYPVQFGSPEWEFGSIGNFLNRLPMFGLGLTLLLSSSLALSFARLSLLFASTLLLFSIIIFVLGVLYVTNQPLVLNAMGAANIPREATVRILVKSGAQFLIYFTVFFTVAAYSVRSSLRLRG